MGFRVEPDAIQGFSTLVGRGAEGATKAVEYTSNNAKIDTMVGGQLWDLVAGDHDSYVEAAKKALGKVQSVLTASQKELSQSAKYYRETDTDEAAKMDATYPGSKGGGGAPSGGGNGSDFADAQDAAAALKAPAGDSDNPLVKYAQGHADEYTMNPVQKTLGTVLDLGSPSTVAVEAVKLLFGVDIFGEINNWVLGDWNKYKDCAEVWGNLGSFCDAVAANLKKGTTNVGVTWEGNAYDAAKVYFDEFSKKLADFKESFDSLKTCYDQAAQMVFQLAEVLKAGVVFLADMAIIWMANMAAATAVNAIPVGGQVASAAMFALAAAQAVMIIERYAALVKAFDATMMAITGLGAVLSTAINGFSAADGFPEASSAGYDNRVVA
ncbi:type VII secretion target [Streptomyces sp. NPDC050211]|uniref:type VII secretion target n=1 Tax=Streptomyces sp. NPDC050211 TaxID=3154932 RepID=UPI0034295848